MKITKKEAVEILGTIKAVEQYQTLDILGYVFLRTSLALEYVEKEYQKVFDFVKDQFKKEQAVDESKLEDKEYSAELDKLFVSYIENSEHLNDFLKEEIEIDFVTFELDKLKDEKFKFSLIKPLVGKIII